MPKKPGRRDKLTEERTLVIVAVLQQAGTTQLEAAKAAGVCEKTFYRWQERAQFFSRILPADWRSRTVTQLREFLDRLGVDEGDVVATGPRGRRLKSDYIFAVEEHGGRYRDFFEALERAKLDGEIAAVAEMRALASGGRTRTVDGRRVWEPVRTTRRRYERDNGRWVEVSREVTEHPPSEKALRFVLERRYERWKPKKAEEEGQSVSPEEYVRLIESMRSSVDESVPSSPEVDGETDD